MQLSQTLPLWGAFTALCTLSTACDDPRWAHVAKDLAEIHAGPGKPHDPGNQGGGDRGDHPGKRLNVQLGPRPFYLVDDMDEGPLKEKLQSCSARDRSNRRDFSIGHRGAALQFPEHTKESYEAAARMGAGIIECDVTFTKDRQLVCRHSQCDLHTTTNILAIPPLAAKCTQPFVPADPATGKPASATCCTSDITRGRVQDAVRQDGRSQPQGDHGRGVPGRHRQLPHRSLLDLRHAAHPRREHRADLQPRAPSSRPSSRRPAWRCRSRATTRRRRTRSR